MIGNIVIHQSILALAAIVSLSVLTATGSVEPSISVPVITGLASGALGYVNGRYAGRQDP